MVKVWTKPPSQRQRAVAQARPKKEPRILDGDWQIKAGPRSIGNGGNTVQRIKALVQRTTIYPVLKPRVAVMINGRPTWR